MLMSGVIKIVIGLVMVAVIVVGVWLAGPLFYDTRVDEELPDVLNDVDSVRPANVTEIRSDAEVPLVSSDQPVSAADQAGPTVLKTGIFEGADSRHKGSGTVRVLEIDGQRYVRFEEDFSVTNGPDLYIYLGRDGKYDPETKLGRLKGSKGSQNYEIPASINVDEYNEVWVWCRAFAVPFSKAQIK